MATKEDKYIEQLKDLGVWAEAFYPAVHQLCTLERELSRVQKAWKATQPDGEKHPDFAHELYAVITQLRRDIRASRDELGLTPKALRRLRGQNVPMSGAEAPAGNGNAAFAELLDTIKDATRYG